MQQNPSKLTVKLTASQLERVLWLAGLVFERGTHGGHTVLLACLERNGTLGYFDSVPQQAPTGHTRVSLPRTTAMVASCHSLLAGQQTDSTRCKKCGYKRHACQCRRCIACQREKDACKCPFPSKTCRCTHSECRVVNEMGEPACKGFWGKRQCEEDLRMIDECQGQLAQRVALPAGDKKKITLEQFDKLHKQFELMKRKCTNKLFAIRQRMADGNGQYTAPIKAQVLPTPKAAYPPVVNCNSPAHDTGYRRKP